MSRRRKANKREILPDPKFGDLILSKFMTCLMMIFFYVNEHWGGNVMKYWINMNRKYQ